MKVYSYSRYVLLMLNSLKILVLTYQLILLPVTFFMGWGLLKEGYNILFVLATMSIFAFVMWFSFNSAVLFYIEIGIDDEAIYVKHYWRWLRIPWENLIALNPTWYSVFRPKDQDFVLSVQKLPLIYWIFGFLYAFTFHPGFVITRSIEKKHQLIAKINQKIKQNQRRLKYNKNPLPH